MSVVINGFEVDGRCIRVFKAYIPNALLQGEAPEEAEICEELSRYKVGDIVKIENNLTHDRNLTGFFKIEAITSQVNPKTRTCIFSMSLSPHEGR
jgi:hypothetical protein